MHRGANNYVNNTHYTNTTFGQLAALTIPAQLAWYHRHKHFFSSFITSHLQFLFATLVMKKDEVQSDELVMLGHNLEEEFDEKIVAIN